MSIIFHTLSPLWDSNVEENFFKDYKEIIDEFITLTGKINDREVSMKGIDASYHYEGYDTFRAEDL